MREPRLTLGKVFLGTMLGFVLFALSGMTGGMGIEVADGEWGRIRFELMWWSCFGLWTTTGVLIVAYADLPLTRRRPKKEAESVSSEIEERDYRHCRTGQRSGYRESSVSVEKRVISIVRDQLGVPEERIAPELNIIGEIDSPDHIELIMVLEEEFDITIRDEDARKIETVAQVIRYIEEHTGRSKVHRSDGMAPAPDSGPLWDRELDG